MSCSQARVPSLKQIRAMTDWAVERVVCGDGSTDESGVTLTEGLIYGSEKRRGGYDTFWVIEAGSLSVWEKQNPENRLHSALQLTNRKCGMKEMSKSNTSSDETALTIGSNSEEQIDGRESRCATDDIGSSDCSDSVMEGKRHHGQTGLKADRAGCVMIKWLRSNPGVIRDIGGPGARKPIASLQKWYELNYGPVIFAAGDGMCAAATLVHAIDSVCGRIIANCYKEKFISIKPEVNNLSGMAELLRQMKAQVPNRFYARVELQRIKKCDRKIFEENPYSFLCDASDCFVVQFDLPGKVDHVVCVDGRRGIIWDNEEKYPLLLNKDSLRLCSGTKSKKARVRAMMMVTQRQKICPRKRPIEVVELD